MASDRAFLRQRLALVERWLAKPARESALVIRARPRRRMRPVGRSDLAFRREARLLRKLLARTREGQALTALSAWRRQLGVFLREHRQRHREMLDAYDAWWELPWYDRQEVLRPPKPPAARYIDADGAPWIIDDRFLALLDDLARRLQMWLGEY